MPAGYSAKHFAFIHFIISFNMYLLSGDCEPDTLTGILWG